MLRHPLFTIYGLGLITLASFAQFSGWNLFPGVNQGQVNPKTVRDNPGAYRSIYTGYPRYSGGK